MEEDQQKIFSIVDTTATQKIFDLKKRISAVSGGTAASKTISILIWLIDYCQSPKNSNKLVTVTSESYPHLSGGAMRDFEIIMKDRHYWKDENWVKTPKPTYSFDRNNKIEFVTFDTYGKAHGARRHVLFINEGNYIPYNIADQLIVRTQEKIWLDWNPTNEFWFYTEIQGKRDDVDFIILTYKDNEALDQNTISEIESHKNNRQWWQVYGLGQLGQLEEQIFTNWQPIKEIPHEARLERRGLDFGYTNDPTALVDVYYYNGGYILDEQLYRKGLQNKQISDFIQNLDGDVLVVADSAEPKSIDELKLLGVNVIGANKGQGSVNQGIQFVQGQKIFYTERSINLIKEYRNYLWQKDKDGKVINKPEEIWNHCMDAIRYALESYMPLDNDFKEYQPSEREKKQFRIGI